MVNIFWAHRINSALSLLTAGVMALLALVGFYDVAQADIKVFTVTTTDDPGTLDGCPDHTIVAGNFVGTDKDGNCTLDKSGLCPLGAGIIGIDISGHAQQ